MAPTEKDSPKSRGILASQSDAAVREAFSKMVDNHQPNGIAAKTAKENQQRALAIMKSVRAKK